MKDHQAVVKELEQYKRQFTADLKREKIYKEIIIELREEIALLKGDK